MYLKGSLQGVALGDLLQVLLESHGEGLFEFHKQDSRKLIYWNQEGLTLLNPEVLNEDRLAQMVVAAGLAEREDVEELSCEDKSISETCAAFAEAGLIDEEQLKNLIRIRLEEEIFKLFEINKGEFEFNTHRDKINAVEKHDLPMMDMMGLAIEVARCRDEWRYIHETISDLDTVFIKNSKDKKIKDDKALEVFKCINGRRTVRNISDSLLTSYLDVCKILVTLVQEKNIRPAEDQEILDLARDLVDSGEEARAGVVLNRLKPIIDNIVDRDNASELADLFHEAGHSKTATIILMDKFREARESGDQDESDDFLQHAHMIDPENTVILNEMANFSANSGDKDSQIGYLSASARSHLKSERFQEGMQVISKILILKPEDTLLLRNLPGDEKGGDFQGSVRFLEEYIIDNIPDFLVSAENNQGAVEFLEKLVSELGYVADTRLIAGIYRLIVKDDDSKSNDSRETEEGALVKSGS
ncbi:MAG: DUF4388 domain-containing protein [Planctomycetota bacterium]